ncbi:MAG: alkaline phosphatase [Clostridia bacterium]|nr:alkaline phosphatase [Clostridia bacterium]
MKKTAAAIISILLLVTFALPAFAAQEDGTFGAYKHVFIIGVDGAGGFFRQADTPEFDRIFASGAVDYAASAETVTISAENWGAILCGVSSMAHGLDNGRVAAEERSGDVQYPSVFSLARKAFPDAELASFVNWEPINHGIIESDIGVIKETRDTDEEVADAICDYFNGGGAPTVFFVQLDSVDGAGHTYGCESEEYMSQISVVDGLLGRIYDSICANGLMEDGLFIVVSDHGHTPEGGHGGTSVTESEVTVAVAGKTADGSGALEDDVRNRDVAAITLYALGIDRPANMTAHIPAGLFLNVPGEKRSIGSDPREVISARLPFLAPVSWKDFGTTLYFASLACGLAVLLLAAVAAVFAARKKRGGFGLLTFLLVPAAAVVGTYASRLFVIWDNLPLYGCVDAVFLLSVAGLVMAAAYAKNGFAFPRGKRMAGTVILSLFLAAAPYEIVVLAVNTLIYHGTRPTFSITVSAFVQMAVALAALIVILARLRRDPGKKA